LITTHIYIFRESPQYSRVLQIPGLIALIYIILSDLCYPSCSAKSVVSSQFNANSKDYFAVKG